MFYTILVFIVGIYVGQEYVALPTVSVIASNAYVYLQSLKEAKNTSTTTSIFEKINEYINKNK